MDLPGHIPPQIHIESHSNVNLCPVFYLKAYLCHIEPSRKKVDGSHMCPLFLCNNRQHMPLYANIISSWVRMVLGITKAYLPSCNVCHALLCVALVAVFVWCTSCRQVTVLEFIPMQDSILHLHQYYGLT